MRFKKRTLLELADLVCGNLGYDNPSAGQNPRYFPYRSSKYITEFFEDLELPHVHDGSTRAAWVADVLEELLAEPHQAHQPPDSVRRLVDYLMRPAHALNEPPDRSNALRQLNAALAREDFEAFYGEDNHCYLRHIGSLTVSALAANPHRPLTAAEVDRRNQLAAYLDGCSEDELIEGVLLPLFRQLGYQRITAAGHKDKALEYGKDVWMRYTLPSQHFLYFGLQAKKGKLDASGATRARNANVAEIHNQALMMLAHEIFDPETNKRVLVDHAFIVAGGEITKAARNWLAEALDRPKRSQILFMDRNDILNLYVVTNVPLPAVDLPPIRKTPKPRDAEPF